MSETGFRRMFVVAALWNLAGGTFILAAVPAPPQPAYYYAWIELFMTFGIGYWLVSRDLYRNRDIALLGAIGKVAFAAIFLWQYATHATDLPRFFLIPVVGDLVFAAFFVVFLRFLRKKGLK
jgi:hypothetical protein